MSALLAPVSLPKGGGIPVEAWHQPPTSGRCQFLSRLRHRQSKRTKVSGAPRLRALPRHNWAVHGRFGGVTDHEVCCQGSAMGSAISTQMPHSVPASVGSNFSKVDGAAAKWHNLVRRCDTVDRRLHGRR